MRFSARDRRPSCSPRANASRDLYLRKWRHGKTYVATEWGGRRVGGRFPYLKVEPPLREGKGREPGTPRHDHPDRPHRHRGRLLRNGARPAQAQSRCDRLYPAGRPHRRPAARGRLPSNDRISDRCLSFPMSSMPTGHFPCSKPLDVFPAAPAISICHDATDLVERAGRPAVGPGACRGRSCLSRQDRGPDWLIWRSASRSCTTPWTSTLSNPARPCRGRPKRALVLAKRSSQLDAVRAACAQREGAGVDIFGPAVGSEVDDLPARLSEYDLVFASARAALEAMAVGCAVIVVRRPRSCRPGDAPKRYRGGGRTIRAAPAVASCFGRADPGRNRPLRCGRCGARLAPTSAKIHHSSDISIGSRRFTATSSHRAPRVRSTRTSSSTAWASRSGVQWEAK